MKELFESINILHDIKEGFEGFKLQKNDDDSGFDLDSVSDPDIDQIENNLKSSKDEIDDKLNFTFSSFSAPKTNRKKRINKKLFGSGEFDLKSKDIKHDKNVKKIEDDDLGFDL